MERKALESAAANYPYLQGLWVIPMGVFTILRGISNLQRRPAWPLMFGIFVVGLALTLLASLFIVRYYRANYGEVKPTRGRHVRQAVAAVAWVYVVIVGANRFLLSSLDLPILLWSLDSPICVYAAAFSLATLAYYAILVGLRAHHIVIWGSMLVAGLLPIWGGLGADRDAVAMFPLGVALIASGLLDQRLLVRSFGSSKSQNIENSNVRG